MQSTPPHPISLRSILILSSHLRLGISFLPDFPPKSYMHSLLPIRATCPAHLILLDLIILIILGEQYKWVPCHHDMARPQVADGDGLQIWRVAANILNKQSRTADKGSSSSFGVGRGANNSSASN
jgi:hypothetical protein